MYNVKISFTINIISLRYLHWQLCWPELQNYVTTMCKYKKNPGVPALTQYSDSKLEKQTSNIFRKLKTLFPENDFFFINYVVNIKLIKLIKLTLKVRYLHFHQTSGFQCIPSQLVQKGLAGLAAVDFQC